MTFIRLTVPSDEARIDTHVAAGLFHATYRLVRSGRLEEGERRWFEEEMEWFNQFLPATRALPTWRAVCWFRGDAGEAISRMWRIVDLVEGEGVPVRVYRTRRPGEIVYADRFQVAAVPWRDTFTARPHARQTGEAPARPGLRWQPSPPSEPDRAQHIPFNRRVGERTTNLLIPQHPNTLSPHQSTTT
jgi:hypothetical protein